MVALVNNAIGLSCLLPSGSGSNTADKNTGASYIHINRLVSTCAVYTQGNTSATGKLCGCGCLLLQSTFVYGAFEMGFHVISDLEMTPISVISSRKSLQVKEGGLNYMTGKSRWSTWKRTDLKSSIWRMGKDVFFQR